MSISMLLRILLNIKDIREMITIFSIQNLKKYDTKKSTKTPKKNKFINILKLLQLQQY